LREYTEFLLRVNFEKVNRWEEEVFSKRFDSKIRKVGIDEEDLRVYP